MIAVVGPVVELVGFSDLFHVGVQRIGAAERSSLSGVNLVGLAVTGGLTVAFADGDDGIASVFTGFQTITSWLVDGEREVGGVDLEDIILVELPHADVNRSRTQLNLRAVIVQVEE